MPTTPRLRGSGDRMFKDILQGMLKRDTHVIQVIFTEFHTSFHNLFSAKLQKLDSISSSPVASDELYTCITQVVKTFLKVTRKIVIWMYQDLIHQFEENYENEDLNIPWIIDSILSDLLFSHQSPTFKDLIRNLLLMKVFKLNQET